MEGEGDGEWVKSTSGCGEGGGDGERRGAEVDGEWKGYRGGSGGGGGGEQVGGRGEK